MDPQLSGIKECTSGDWLLLRDKACKDEWFIAKYDGEEGTASDKLYVGPDGETTYYWGPVPWDSRRCPMDGPENESNRTIRCDCETITNGKQNNSHGILVENFQDELYGYISSIEFILYSGMVEILVPSILRYMSLTSDTGMPGISIGKSLCTQDIRDGVYFPDLLPAVISENRRRHDPRYHLRGSASPLAS